MTKELLWTDPSDQGNTKLSWAKVDYDFVQLPQPHLSTPSISAINIQHFECSGREILNDNVAKIARRSKTMIAQHRLVAGVTVPSPASSAALTDIDWQHNKKCLVDSSPDGLNLTIMWRVKALLSCLVRRQQTRPPSSYIKHQQFAWQWWFPLKWFLVFV